MKATEPATEPTKGKKYISKTIDDTYPEATLQSFLGIPYLTRVTRRAMKVAARGVPLRAGKGPFDFERTTIRHILRKRVEAEVQWHRQERGKATHRHRTFIS